ncbi:DUF3017 domain-containing protein [Streptomyces sp. AK02-01A]|uniref:DUF3017 domain-containing protein n=1 Tax=Streptomyces sp. AK02-01A TaxID=3028648 RepID=UPI0029A28B10|nr:DUF3017 domain-containing protein [Streptomyces sp. AK02-01A]MDX3852243.1 DUF3017 domain-containing protein [Streptomyces sp. AK02-01A]
MGAGTSAGDAARSPRGARKTDTAEPAAPIRDVPEPALPATGVAPRARAGTVPAGPAEAVLPVAEAGPAAEPAEADSTARGAAPDAAPREAVGHTDQAEHAEDTDHAEPAGDNEPAEEAEPAEETRRFSPVTRDTAPPEGAGRAAPRDAPAPARQWPLLSVLGTIGLGLLIVGLHPFAEAFRIGTILIGLALIGGAALRRVLPSVGMLAVRSRFTDMVTYGLLGLAIVLLALMTQPRPWLEIPFLEDVVHSTVT